MENLIKNTKPNYQRDLHKGQELKEQQIKDTRDVLNMKF